MAPILASFTGRNQFGGSGGSGMLTSGGTEYTNGDFTIKAFFYNSGSSENLTIDSAPPGSELEIVVIGGGGGGNGGYGSGGGGGAGAINYIPAMQAVSGHTHTILVGSGGPAGSGGADNTSNTAATHGRRGENSTFTYAGSTTFTVVAVVVETKVFTIHQIIKIVMEIAVQVVALVTIGHHKEVVVTHPDLKHGLVDIVLVH